MNGACNIEAVFAQERQVKHRLLCERDTSVHPSALEEHVEAARPFEDCG